MKKAFSLMALVLTLSLGLGSIDAEAKRLGGGKSSGMQRQSTMMDKTPTTPAQAPMASNSMAAKSPAAAPAAAAPAKRSWMGPIAGLAAGLGLAALASHFGFGDELANMLMIGLLVMAVLAVVGFFMRKRALAAQTPVMAGAGATGNGMNYAGSAAQQHAQAQHRVEVPMPASSGTGIGAGIGAGLTEARNEETATPAGFDVAGFVRSAKVHFIRLQAANDERNLDDIREFTTPEMFAEIKMDMAERGNANQQTDVLTVEAVVLEVVDDATRQVASVRFSGTLREDNKPQAETFDEVWHLIKPHNGSSGWLLAGIQQTIQH